MSQEAHINQKERPQNPSNRINQANSSITWIILDSNQTTIHLTYIQTTYQPTMKFLTPSTLILTLLSIYATEAVSNTQFPSFLHSCLLVLNWSTQVWFAINQSIVCSIRSICTFLRRLLWGMWTRSSWQGVVVCWVRTLSSEGGRDRIGRSITKVRRLLNSAEKTMACGILCFREWYYK